MQFLSICSVSFDVGHSFSFGILEGEVSCTGSQIRGQDSRIRQQLCQGNSGTANAAGRVQNLRPCELNHSLTYDITLALNHFPRYYVDSYPVQAVCAWSQL